MFGNFLKKFLKKIFSLISLFVLEGIYFYNYTTPEFNVNVCQLPFWALTVYYFWKSIKTDKILIGYFWSIFSFRIFIKISFYISSFGIFIIFYLL